MRALVICLALSTLATPALAIDGPEQLVRALYRLEQIPLKSRDIDHYFARDLAAAIKNDIAGEEPGQTNDGDYRYDAQDFEITGLTFVNTTNAAGGQVAVSFRNFGTPATVIYNMCLSRGGWRIANVAPSDEDMRQRLGLPSAPVRC